MAMYGMHGGRLDFLRMIVLRKFAMHGTRMGLVSCNIILQSPESLGRRPPYASQVCHTSPCMPYVARRAMHAIHCQACHTSPGVPCIARRAIRRQACHAYFFTCIHVHVIRGCNKHMTEIKSTYIEILHAVLVQYHEKSLSGLKYTPKTS